MLAIQLVGDKGRLFVRVVVRGGKIVRVKSERLFRSVRTQERVCNAVASVDAEIAQPLCAAQAVLDPEPAVCFGLVAKQMRILRKQLVYRYAVDSDDALARRLALVEALEPMRSKSRSPTASLPVSTIASSRTTVGAPP